MNIVWQRLQALRQEHGQDMVEYAMLLAFLLIAALTAITALGNAINETFYSRFANFFTAL